MDSLIKKNLALLLGVLWICIALNFFLLPHSIISAFSIYLIAFFMRLFMRLEQRMQAKKSVEVQETAKVE